MSIQQCLLAGGLRVVELTISSTQTSTYNLFTAAGSPADPVEVRLTVNADCQYGIDQGAGWAAGSVCVVDNNAGIYGTGGQGGGGGVAFGTYFGGAYAASTGGAGGDAMVLRIPTTIDNANGYIFGGGGGGGGGGACADYDPPGTGARAGGGGGGGGQGFNLAGGGAGGDTNSGGAFDGQTGGSGSDSAVGSGGAGGVGFGNYGGAGGAGGDWGQDGNGGAPGNGPRLPTGGYSGFGNALGGSAGFAVRLNGNSCTFTAGNTAIRVKGYVL